MSKHLTIHILANYLKNGCIMSEIEHNGYCKKVVPDVTKINNTQIVFLLKANKRDTYGHFYNNQLNYASVIPRKKIAWLKYFFTLTLHVFLFGMEAFAQENSIVKKMFLSEEKVTSSLKKIDEAIEYIDSGKVALLPEVLIKTTCSSTLIKCGTSCVSLVRSSSSLKNESKFLQAPTPFIKINEISIYPNPITSNSKLNITWKKDISENQLVEIFSATGHLIQRETIKISYKTKTSFLYLKNINQGFYIIKITNLKNGEKNAKEFIVQ